MSKSAGVGGAGSPISGNLPGDFDDPGGIESENRMIYGAKVWLTEQRDWQPQSVVLSLSQHAKFDAGAPGEYFGSRPAPIFYPRDGMKPPAVLSALLLSATQFDLSAADSAPLADATRNDWVYSRNFEHAAVRVDLAKRTAEIDWKK